MGPQSRPVEFNSSERLPRRGLPADPVEGRHRGAPRTPEGALSTGRAPRPVRRQSQVLRERWRGFGPPRLPPSRGGRRSGRPRFYSPLVRRPAGEPRNRMPPLPPHAPRPSRRSRPSKRRPGGGPRGRARAPASRGRSEDGLFTVCPGRRVARRTTRCGLAGCSRLPFVHRGSPGSVANRSAPHQTRLETRTKESNMCASHWVLRNPEAQ